MPVGSSAMPEARARRLLARMNSDAAAQRQQVQAHGKGALPARRPLNVPRRLPPSTLPS